MPNPLFSQPQHERKKKPGRVLRLRESTEMDQWYKDVAKHAEVIAASGEYLPCALDCGTSAMFQTKEDELTDSVGWYTGTAPEVVVRNNQSPRVLVPDSRRGDQATLVFQAAYSSSPCGAGAQTTGMS